MYQYNKRKTGDVTLIDVTPVPDWQEFESFLHYFIEKEHAELIECDSGMDRHQARLIIDNQRFLLHFEHYTDSIWLEVDN